jgi:hypothetical protein
VSTDLVSWLRTQLDADEKAQREPYCSDGWHSNKCELHAEPPAGEPWPDCDCGVPARVLAEVDAKRRIIKAVDALDSDGGIFLAIGTHLDTDAIWAALVLPYADRAGYDERWRA